MFTSFNLVKNFFITVEYDIMFWAGFFPGFLTGFFKVGLPKKTHTYAVATGSAIYRISMYEI